ncbi:GntR family transcriptional regulator [Saccharomonospora sp. NPDC006951]
MAEVLHTGERIGRRRSLTDEVIDSVHGMVRRQELREGELYSVYQVAEALGISRSPVRDGLLKLEAAGLVSFERNRGFRIVVPSGREIVEIFAVRIALEPSAAATVAQRADAEVTASLRDTMTALTGAAARADEPAFWAHDHALHETILTAAGNRQAATVVRGLREKTRLIGPGTTVEARSLPAIADEHRPIVTAITGGDPGSARRRMRDHLVATGRLLAAQTMGVTPGDPAIDELWTDVTGERPESD